MDLHIINNHIVISCKTSIGDRNLVLDTGNPINTFFRENTINEYYINGLSYKVKSDFISSSFANTINWGNIEKLVGIEINGFLGFDFLAENDLLIDFNSKVIELNNSLKIENSISSKLNFYMNVPFLKLSIGKYKINALFDTGAKHSILVSDLCKNLNNLHSTEKDYNPNLGEFEIQLFSSDITIGNKTFNNKTISCSSKYDFAIQFCKGASIQGILGISALLESIVFISYKTKTLSII